MSGIKPALFNLAARKNSTEILKELPIKEGQAVADLGSCGGYYTLLFAERVGAGGTVYAVDIDSKNLRFVCGEIKRRGITDRVILALAEPDDFILGAESCDLVFSRNSFHHIASPEVYFKKVARALRPEGILAVIDHNGSGVSRHKNHFTPPGVIQRSLAKSGFRLLRTVDGIPGASFQIFNTERI